MQVEPYFALMIHEPEVLDILARFAGPAGQAAGLDRVIADFVSVLAGQIALLQQAGAARQHPDPATLAEGVLAFVLYAASTAQCAILAPDRPSRQSAAHDLLARQVTAWLAP